jgi:hypothetical protein
MPAGDERRGGPGGLAVVEHIEAGEVFGVIPQLDPPPHQSGVNGIGVAFQRDGGGAGDLAHHRPAERLAQPGGIGLAGRAAGLEQLDRDLPGLGVHPPAGHPLRPGGEQVIELIDRLDAVVGGLGQERFADIAVEPFLLSPPFRLTGQSCLSCG